MRPWYLERPPEWSLSSTLACTWSADVGGDTHRLIPDACLDLLWIDSGRLVLCGPETSAWTFALPPGTTAVGVRFKPGIAANVFGLDISELRDTRIPVADLWGDGPARRLNEQLGEAATPDARVALLERLVQRRAADADVAVDPVAAEVADRVGGLGTPVGELARTIGISERQLLRRCNAAFGYGPTVLARILRIQRFLDLARRHGTGVPLARLAFTAGYADQPHLSREVRAIAGLTPTAIVSDPFKTPAPGVAMMQP